MARFADQPLSLPWADRNRSTGTCALRETVPQPAMAYVVVQSSVPNGDHVECRNCHRRLEYDKLIVLAQEPGRNECDQIILLEYFRDEKEARHGKSNLSFSAQPGQSLIGRPFKRPSGRRHQARLFYGRLFEIDPTTRPLFNGADSTDQRRKLILALTLVVQGLDRFESLVPTLAALGRRHAQYRVSDQHYKTVGEALLWTLKQDLRSDWTPEVEEAWSAPYTSVSDVMRAGARDLKEDCSVDTVDGGAMPFESHFDERDRTSSLDAGEPLLSADWWITRP